MQTGGSVGAPSDWRQQLLPQRRGLGTRQSAATGLSRLGGDERDGEEGDDPESGVIATNDFVEEDRSTCWRAVGDAGIFAAWRIDGDNVVLPTGPWSC